MSMPSTTPCRTMLQVLLHGESRHAPRQRHGRKIRKIDKTKMTTMTTMTTMIKQRVIKSHLVPPFVPTCGLQCMSSFSSRWLTSGNVWWTWVTSMEILSSALARYGLFHLFHLFHCPGKAKEGSPLPNALIVITATSLEINRLLFCW